MRNLVEGRVKFLSISFVIILFLQILIGGESNLKSYINDGPSMVPTIYDGDRMIVDTDISKGIERNDLIIFKAEGKSFVKRVLAVSGDQIQVNEKGIYINNKLYKEARDLGIPEINITIKENEFFVVGDNVDNSYDSRSYGPITHDQIIGKVIKIFHMHSQ